MICILKNSIKSILLLRISKNIKIYLDILYYTMERVEINLWNWVSLHTEYLHCRVNVEANMQEWSLQKSAAWQPARALQSTAASSNWRLDISKNEDQKWHKRGEQVHCVSGSPWDECAPVKAPVWHSGKDDLMEAHTWNSLNVLFFSVGPWK